jgi:phosphoribosylaminoimidazolecarboxamide formyltransferase/IMP cyclohydrolase
MTDAATDIAPTALAEEGRVPIRRALVSVYDKTGLAELARSLVEAGVELVSTGTTAARIAAEGLPVTQVEELTGFPECLDGRVKTLHPRVHAGLLADMRLPTHAEALESLDNAPFDLLVVNLYPFTQTVLSGAGPAECIEQIDIGGPSMVRGAAKNHACVAVVTSADQYDQLYAALDAGGFTLAERQALATAAFVHTATYDVAVASWLGNVVTDTSGGSGFPSWIGATWDRDAVLRYGENPHQRAALYTRGAGQTGLAQATQLHGKAMSYNNYVDADAAWRAAHDHAEPAVAIIKHANPCGIAVAAPGAADPIADAHRRAHECDPVSAFGGVIAANRTVTLGMAETVSGIFTEVLVAPAFEAEAVELLTQKKNIRLLTLPEDFSPTAVELRQVSGGMLLQQADRRFASSAEWTLAAGDPADEETLADLDFAWRACRAVKSNAILLASGGASVGVGMGQVNRVDSCKLAVERAGDRASGSVAASDAFFPFADGLQILIDGGVRAVVQPGGSVRDEEVVAAANAAGITMYFTGERHFFH